MSTCKDCIHFDVCQVLRYGDITNCESDGCGGFFKPKSRFVELPCEVGQTVYAICPDIDFFMTPNKNYLKIRGFVISEHVVTLEDVARWITIPPHIGAAHWGKTIFLSREEAEAELRKRGEE